MTKPLVPAELFAMNTLTISGSLPGHSLIVRLVPAQTPSLERAWGMFSQRMRERLHGRHRRLLQVGGRLDNGRDRPVGQQRMDIPNASAQFSRPGAGLCGAEQRKTRLAASQAASLAQALIAREKSRLELAGTLYDKSNPLALLGRGFALVRGPAGEMATTAQQARQAGALVPTFADGQVLASLQHPPQKCL